MPINSSIDKKSQSNKLQKIEDIRRDKKLAILKTDSFIDPHTKQDNIEKLYRNFFADSRYELEFFDILNNKYPNPSSYHLFLITGSRHSVTDPLPWIMNLIDFINNNELDKLIGICFGHQLIAKARGGIVERGDWHVGIKPVTIHTSGKHQYNLRFNHQDHVKKLPPNSALLASSPECQYTMFQQGAHTLAMQFHPEFTQEHHTKVIHRINSKQGFTQQEFAAFLKDINGETNNSKALQVIKNFLSI